MLLYCFVIFLDINARYSWGQGVMAERELGSYYGLELEKAFIVCQICFVVIDIT